MNELNVDYCEYRLRRRRSPTLCSFGIHTEQLQLHFHPACISHAVSMPTSFHTVLGLRGLIRVRLTNERASELMENDDALFSDGRGSAWKRVRAWWWNCNHTVAAIGTHRNARVVFVVHHMTAILWIHRNDHSIPSCTDRVARLHARYLQFSKSSHTWIMHYTYFSDASRSLRTGPDLTPSG